MNWMDICVIIIIIVNGLRGLSLGLVLSVFNILSFIVAAIVSKMYFSQVSTFIISNTNLTKKVNKFIIDRINTPDNILAKDSLDIFGIMNLPKTLSNFLMKSDEVEAYSEGVIDNIHSYIAERMTIIIIDLISIVLVFIGALLILNILGHILDRIASLPVINQFNRIGGLIFGSAKGFIMVFILLAIMVPIVSIFPESFIVHALKNSTITKDLYNYNLLVKILASFLSNTGYFLT